MHLHTQAHNHMDCSGGGEPSIAVHALTFEAEQDLREGLRKVTQPGVAVLAQALKRTGTSGRV
eukprot:1160131-Pelagomonas_calceolata.AAC.5